MQRRNRTEKRLRAKDLDTLKPGIHEDGSGLRFKVEPSADEPTKGGARRWVLRLTINGRRVDRGLGSYPDVRLEKARDEAAQYRLAARDGRDLAHERRQRAAKAVTFKQAFEQFFEVKRQRLTNGKHVKQWSSTMQTYVFPKIGNRPVGEITHPEIIEVLEPIWLTKPETAKRVLQRMGYVFKLAIRHGMREKASPCEYVVDELGTGHRDVDHHASLPHTEVRDFIKTLGASQATAVMKLAFEWLILTATRSGETRGAKWTEIDEKRALWVIPKERMKKGRKEHIVPLSDRCLEIAGEARALNPESPLFFPSEAGRPLSDMTFTKWLRDRRLADRATAHGFRSSFRNWATEVDKCREVVAEAALAHTVKDKTEAAYRRSVYLEERTSLMRRWADYCAG
jgi:integrase